MEAEPLTIHAAVSAGVLDKADRLFRNDDAGVWVELLQNSRRAGATLITVFIEERSDDCLVTFADNGAGIEDFQKLLTLGGSGWEAETQEKEDPAGMGFFSLCRSEVRVYSGHRWVEITPAVFLGKAETKIQAANEFVQGTRLQFTRKSTKSSLRSELERVTEFCPVRVLLNGEPLPAHDFLEGALYREWIDGIEVGFATKFRSSEYVGDANWNFYGARIRGPVEECIGLLPQEGKKGVRRIHARFNVLDTAKIKLQLPDRRAIIEDDDLKDFRRKARAAAYRFFQMQAAHALPYANWREAKELGVDLPEAIPLLISWHAKPQDESIDSPFGRGEPERLTDLSHVALIDYYLPNAHTFEAAIHSRSDFPWQLYEEGHAFKGYSWYDQLPRIVDTRVFVDEVPYLEWSSESGRPAKIEIESTFEQAGQETSSIRIPALIHVDSDVFNELSLVAIAASPWDSPDLAGPFPVVDFLMCATFAASDSCESDSWDTQRDDYESEVQSAVDEYFRGPRATLLSLLRSSLNWRVERLAKELGIHEIRFIRAGSTRNWDVEIIEIKNSDPAAAESI